MFKKLLKNIKEFWRIFKLEFKINFGGHRLKMLKFMGILVVPFLYGFIYICAMYDPLANTKGDLDITFVASEKMANNWNDPQKASDPIYSSLRKSIHSKRDITSQIYEASTINQKDIEEENDSFKKEIGKHNVSIVIKPIYNKKEDPKHLNPLNLTEYVGYIFADAIVKNSIDKSLINKILNQNISLLKSKIIISALEKSMENYSNPIDVYFNYKKNFVLGFGANNKIASSSTLIELFNSVLSSPSTFSHAVVQDGIINSINERLSMYHKLNNKVPIALDPKMESSIRAAFPKQNVVNQQIFDPTIFVDKYEGGKPLEKYGIGLAPLFISIGLWIGALSTTLMITPKTHERGTSKIKAFFAKLCLIWIANIMQVTILFGALSLLGFADTLGSNLPLFFLTGFFISFLFSMFVFSIRCMIPAKITGLFTVTIILLIQITSSGALFPTYAQPEFFQVMNNFVPFNYSVDALRETLVNTNLTNWGMNLFVIILMAVPFVTIASIIYKKRKENYELANKDAFKEISEERQTEIKEIEAPLFKKFKKAFSKNSKAQKTKKVKSKTKKGGE
ncbi:YhgE/Pip family protein [Mycoplasma marinum]|uniref:ABC-2 type transporter transmembrane domain-containing protein n=1 Tax=Mycoplasma marinum TaxID=1937190 RepID=A0A4R0XJ67_9MOLU|nr:YhgE/Pip family protein [Mycoplasma marinum]TCG10653.1 hypothetical protein C4B24_04275 [Mycoplasma marinum]